MKKSTLILFIIFSLLLFIVSCSEGDEKNNSNEVKTTSEKTNKDIKITETRSSSNVPLIIKSGIAPNYSTFTSDTTQVSQYIRRIFQDNKGNLWFGTVGDGVCRFDGNSLTYFSTLDGLSGNNIQGIVEDKEGNIWLGTNDGLSKINGKKITNYTIKDGLNSNFILSLYISKSGVIWVGTDSGICYFEDKIFKPFSITGLGEALNINCILEDKAGNIWFATNGGGVWRFDGKNKFNYTEKDGLCENKVMWIMQDQSENIWFSTFHNGICQIKPSSLDKINAQSFTNYSEEEGLYSRWRVISMKQDTKGIIWISDDGRLCNFDGKKFTIIKEGEGLTNGGIQSICEDKTGNIWFGSGAGIFYYDGKSFVNIPKKGPWPEKF